MLLCRELKTRAMAKRKFFQERGKGNPILRRKVLTQFSFSKTYHTWNKSPALKTKFELHILSHLCLSFPKVISNNFFYHFVTIRQEGWSNITNLNDLPLFFLFFLSYSTKSHLVNFGSSSSFFNRMEESKFSP